jgi:hypothetical protein
MPHAFTTGRESVGVVDGPLERTYEMSWAKIEKLADLKNTTVAQFPFQGRKTGFMTSQEGYTFSAEDVQVLSQTIGDPPDILRLELFLRKHCDIATESGFHRLTWPRVIAALKLHLVEQGIDSIISGASGQPVKTDGLSPEVRAIAALAENPNATMTAIARKAGVHRTRLYDMPRFMAAWNLHRAGQEEPSHGAKPRGEIDPETGTIEAHKKSEY